MLRKRSRAMASNQAFKTENGSLSSPKDKEVKPTSSFFGSPRFFTGFSVKGSSETESAMSPTSILDSKSFTAFVNPFWSDNKTANTNTTSRLSSELCLENKHHQFEKKYDSKGVGLGIVDALNDEETNQKLLKLDSRMVLSQLKIQIPSLPPSVLSPTESPKSPADFGIKTRNTQSGLMSFSSGLSPLSVKKNSLFGSSNSGLETPTSPHVFTRFLSASEMELSEDYTCVISHGPNPKTTHIFGDCIVENCCGVVGLSPSKMDTSYSADCSHFLPENFLSFCYNCKKKLGEGKDIYMYRGEKAFCSKECRYQEMLFDEGMEKSDMEDTTYFSV